MNIIKDFEQYAIFKKSVDKNKLYEHWYDRLFKRVIKYLSDKRIRTIKKQKLSDKNSFYML